MEEFQFETICEAEDPYERVTVVRMTDSEGSFYILYRHCGERLKTLAKICKYDPSKNKIEEELSQLSLFIIRDISNGVLS